jgi:DNA-binding MarR family transcriptional regulator
MMTTRTEEPRGCTNLKLHQLGRRIARLYDADQRALGLKGTQYSLLSHVVKLAPVRPSDLARAMRLSPSTLTRTLAPLVAQGWLALEPGEDGRSRSVLATATGRELLGAAQRGWKRSQLEVNRRLGAERVVRLHALLDECLALLEDVRDPAGANDAP